MKVLVVLGAALRPDGGLGPALAERVDAAVAAWKAGAATWLLMTGAREAPAMKRRALELGVPEDAIWTENRAQTTRENALFSAEILRLKGASEALIVTQAYHRTRSLAAFRRAGVQAEALPFEGRRPKTAARLQEWCARALYKLRGWS